MSDVTRVEDHISKTLSGIVDNGGSDAIIPGVTDMLVLIGFMNSTVAESIFTSVDDGRFDKWVELNKSTLMDTFECKSETDFELNVVMLKGMLKMMGITRNAIVTNVKNKLKQ